MRQHLALFVAVATLAVGVATLGSQSVAGATLPRATAASTIETEALGQGASAVAPDRVLLLQQRTFAPAADSGAHAAAGPTVLYVDTGIVEFTVEEGAALLTRHGATAPEPVAAGDEVDLQQGDAVFYDAGVVHEVANPYDAPAVTLEARLNPAEAPSATPTP